MVRHIFRLFLTFLVPPGQFMSYDNIQLINFTLNVTSTTSHQFNTDFVYKNTNLNKTGKSSRIF